LRLVRASPSSEVIGGMVGGVEEDAATRRASKWVSLAYSDHERDGI
jgi:hypothetical protein